MGTDIHAFVEEQNETGAWDFISSVLGSKNYVLFAWLANVRNDGTINTPFPPRGLPSDLSKEVETVARSWSPCDDGSYLYPEELQHICNLWREQDPDHHYQQELQDVVDNMAKTARLVFWFDS